MAAGPVADLVGQAEQHDDRDREQEQCRRVLRQARAKAHHAVGRRAGSGDDREAEHEQPVREQRAHDRRPGDDELAGREREQHDEELGQVPERGLQGSRDRGAEPLADGLGRNRDRPGESGQCDGRDDEDHDRLDVREVEDGGDDCERQDPGEDGHVPAHARTLVAQRRPLDQDLTIVC